MVIIDAVKNVLSYILDIRWHQIPTAALCLGVLIGMSYCAALIVIAFPTSIWEHFTKRKAREDIQGKIVTVVTACFSVVAIVILFK